MNQLKRLLGTYRDKASTNRDMGTMFERLVKGYLKTEPIYCERFSEVWLWEEFPESKGSDIGIDIVAKDEELGGYCAIQCKFYEAEHKIDKRDIDSFMSVSGKSIYTSRIIVSTTDKWSKNAEEALNDNKRYKTVWQVLQALRAHDDRINAIANKIELNNKTPDQINVIGIGFGGDEVIVKKEPEMRTMIPRKYS